MLLLWADEIVLLPFPSLELDNFHHLYYLEIDREAGPAQYRDIYP